jgi:hypothetical protein
MTDTNKDVDLYAELKATLEAVDESEVEETSVASDQKPKEEVIIPTDEDNKDENAELSDEDISKLSPRAQKRIREQAEEIKRLAELNADKSPETPQEDDKTTPHNFKNVSDFLAAVEDEPSRKLLENFYSVIKSETSNILAPIEQKNNEAKFETEFSKYEKIEGLADYKNDLKKTFLRNPNQSFEGLVGKVALDLQLNKIKPIEAKPSSPNRGKVDTANLSKDELYDMLDNLRN